MWHAPNQRFRAIANAKKREREKARRPIHIKRIHAQLTFPSTSASLQQMGIRLILNDLSVKGVGLFSPDPLIAGQEVVLNILDPFKLDLKAKVIWCQKHAANSHVLSTHPYSYRMGLEFLLENSDQQQAMKIFYEDISKKLS